MLETPDLTVRFGGHVAVSAVSCAFETLMPGGALMRHSLGDGLRTFLLSGRRAWLAVALSAPLAFNAVAAVQALPQLNIDTSQTTVSGVSSGGYMAVQLHVAYSATFRKGVGVVAAGPFYCAQGSVVNATGRCMAHDTSIPVSSLVSTTNSWASSGAVDPTANLANSRVYLFSGASDSVVKTAVVDDLKTYYGNFVSAANIAYQKNLPAEHAWLTDDFGSGCGVKADPYINDCDFDQAGAMLQHLYGTLNPRNNGTLGGTFVEFDQTGFTTGHALGTTGWAYVPQACQAGATCRLHVALHGCKQNVATIGQQYVRNTGINRWADTNQIVVLYPQTGETATNACWDWWGYDSADYAKKSGPQMKAVKAMVDQLSSGVSNGSLPPTTSVGAGNATASSMKLTWPAVSGASGYRVYRNGARATAAPVTSASFTDSGLNAGTSYRWSVKTVDASGRESGFSPVATASTTGFTPVCHTADNVSHVAWGRAYVLWGYDYAYGSNQGMGLYNVFITSTLRQTSAGYYAPGTCY